MKIIAELGQGLCVALCQIGELREQTQNARVMEKEMFNTLVRNIKNRKALESLPFCAEVEGDHGKTHYEVVSGHHRVRAARAAGMSELYVLLDRSGLKRSQIRAKQLAHNSIAGQDDEVILAELFSQITDANDRLESFIQQDALKWKGEPLLETELPVQAETVTFAFFPRDLQAFKDSLFALEAKLAVCDELYCVNSDMIGLFKAAVDKAVADTKIKSPGVAIGALCERILGLTKDEASTESPEERIKFELDCEPVFSAVMVKLFRQCEVEARQTTFSRYPDNLSGLLDVIAGGKAVIQRPDKDLKIKCKPARDKAVLLAFTGGKDCVAAALKLREQMGREVELLHVEAMNNAYAKDELANSQRLADELKMKLHFAKFIKPGRGPHHGNPVRNQMILSLTADKALELGLSEIAAGNTSDEEIAHIDYHWGISDSIEMHTAFSAYIKSATGGKLLCYPSLLRGVTESYCLIWRHAPQLLDLVAGCMTPSLYRKTHHDRNERKYKVKLHETRCGSCHKCCVERIVLSKLGILETNDGYDKYVRQRLVELCERERPQGQWTLASAYESYVDEGIIAEYQAKGK
jgi:7-cyano-7-deazaguanine synthase in queuosine biosynthesis